MNDFDACRSLIYEVAESGTADTRANICRTVERFKVRLSPDDLALLRADLEQEIRRRRPATVPLTQVEAHGQKVLVLQEALKALSDKRHVEPDDRQRP
jgi:hypothetical protein